MQLRRKRHHLRLFFVASLAKNSQPYGFSIADSPRAFGRLSNPKQPHQKHTVARGCDPL